MKKTLIVLAACIAMSACAVPAITPIEGRSSASAAGVATAALWGTWEMNLAPAYTRHAVLLHRATRLADARKITRANAIDIQLLTDRAKALLDFSRRGSATDPTPEQRQALAEAKLLLNNVDAIMEQKQ